ncbi:MAG: carboxymethylenebutenolidase [Peptostreptococcaceae bacterium]|nr:carboxymethylenebutenolidase [Peptostreptococcaceae bacterium]
MKKKKIIKRIIITLLILVIAILGAFLIYANVYMHSSYTLEENAVLLDNGDYYLEGSSDVGIIFYPGAKVEETAYLPMLSKLQEKGYTCILVKMPLRFAFLGTNSADDYYDEYPEIKSWYMSGHSLGGAMASSYASDNEDLIDGLLLLGAYVYGDFNPENSITIYGENDLGLDRSKIGDVNVYEIEGGNHAGFGYYGVQNGDGELIITREEQQDEAANLIDSFIQERTGDI